MTKKITLEEKVECLDRYIGRPQSLTDPAILRAVKSDVVRAATKKVGRASEMDNRLYNECMGLYRQFLASRNSHLDMSGRKAAINSRAMRGLITYIRGFQKATGKPHSDGNVLAGLRLIFDNWDRLNDFHRNRIKLPDIHANIEEIIIIIRDGHNKKSAVRNEYEQRKLELKLKKSGR